MEVKHAELGNAACGVRAVVAPGSDSNHVESQPWSYLSTDRCYPLCSELKVFQDAAGVQGRGTWRGQITLHRGGGTVLSFEI